MALLVWILPGCLGIVVLAFGIHCSLLLHCVVIGIEFAPLLHVFPSYFIVDVLAVLHKRFAIVCLLIFRLGLGISLLRVRGKFVQLPSALCNK